MLAVLPLLGADSTFFSSELSLKYFISQRVASVIFLIFYLLITSFYSSYINYLSSIFIIFKLGLPPFHRWLVRIIFAGPYTHLWLIFFVQKFIPLQFLRVLSLPRAVLVLILILTSLICFIFIKRVTRVRTLLIISAWVNTSWLVLATPGSGVWFNFLCLYGWILFVTLKALSFFSVSKISSIMYLSFIDKLICVSLFFNLAGLPPFRGFFIKLYLLKYMLLFNSVRLILILFFLSLTVLYTYISVFYYSVGAYTTYKLFYHTPIPMGVKVNFISVALCLPVFLSILR
jgi:NADH-ubiquinone oxidoreductase chain 2